MRTTPLALVLVLLALLAVPILAQTEEVSESEAVSEASVVEQAEYLFGQNRFEEAHALAEELLRAAPESEGARVMLAKVAIARGNVEKAQIYIDDLLERDPRDPDYHTLQGMVFAFAEDHQAAIHSLQTALELGAGRSSPERMASYGNTLVLTYHRSGDSKSALKACLSFLEQYPQDGDLYLSCSRLYREAGQFAEAAEIARQGLEARPDFFNLYASLALAEAGLGNHQASEAAYRELQARDPELAQMLRATLDGERPDKAEYKLKHE